MVILQGKVKFRKTGENVFVVSHNGESDKRRKTDWVSYIDSNLEEHQMVKGLNLAWDFDEIDKYEEREKQRAVETHLCIFSGMAMQSLIRAKDIETLNTDEGIDFITNLSVEYGKALCAKLDKVDLADLLEEQEPEPETEETAVDEIVEINGKKYRCVEKEKSDCPDCDLHEDFQNKGLCPHKGYCVGEFRKDKKDVVFVREE